MSRGNVQNHVQNNIQKDLQKNIRGGGIHMMRAEWQKMRHTILLPIHVVVPLLGSGVFLLYYWMGNRHGITEISGFMRSWELRFRFLLQWSARGAYSLRRIIIFKRFSEQRSGQRRCLQNVRCFISRVWRQCFLLSEILRSDTMCCFTQRS